MSPDIMKYKLDEIWMACSLGNTPFVPNLIKDIIIPDVLVPPIKYCVFVGSPERAASPNKAP
jgi:hypothetical protein